jgi:hypothetical protein
VLLFSAMFWCVVGAGVTAWLVDRQFSADLAAIDRGEAIEVDRGADASGAFALCALFLLAAPFVLGRARGARGFLEGLGIVLGAMVGNAITLAVLGALPR